MDSAIFSQPVFQITVPLMVTFIGAIWTAQWSQNKRFEDIQKDFSRGVDEIIKRLDRIEAKLESHSDRITRLETQASPVISIRGNR